MHPRLEAVLIILGMLVTGFALYVGFALWLERRTERALAEAARRLGLHAVPATAGARSGTPAGYEGTIAGITVRAVFGWYFATVAGAIGAKVAPMSRIVVTADCPAPLDFAFELRRRGWPVGRRPDTGDPMFDRACRVRTDDERRFREFFASKELRDLVRVFVERRVGLAIVHGKRVLVPVYGAHIHGAPAVAEEVAAAVGVARALGVRAVQSPF